MTQLKASNELDMKQLCQFYGTMIKKSVGNQCATLSHLSFMLFCHLLIFFKINFFKNFFQEYHRNVKQFGP